MYVLNFSDEQAVRLSLSGGKGANLARLAKHGGLNVPGGFVITTQFFKEYILPTAKQAGENAKQTIAAVNLPNEAVRHITAAYEQLGADTPVAVRSSATAEDLPDASFAGQQDSYLNVCGANDVVKAAINCFASLYNERAVSYRAKNRFNEDEVYMAVIVQKMVDAKAAGVMFTADPMTHDRYTVAVEAVEGLGDALVSGYKTPDTYNVREGAVKRESRGGSEDVLTDEQILRLAQIGKGIEKEYGTPQDIEWVLDQNGAFCIVQSRAVTTLYPLPHSKDGFKRLFVAVGVMQMMTDVMLPLGISFWEVLPILNTEKASPLIQTIGGRMYIEITHNLKGVNYLALKQKFTGSDERVADAFAQVMARKDYIKSIPKGKAHNFMLKSIVIPSLRKGFKAYRTKNSQAYLDDYLQNQQRSIAETAEKLRGLSGAAVFEYILNTDMPVLAKSLMDPKGLGPLMVCHYMTKSIDKEGEELLGRKSVSADISKWLHYNITSEMGHQVTRIAQAARNNADVVKYIETAGDNFSLEQLKSIAGSEQTVKEFEVFFEKFGMRCPGEIDITKARFAEDPTKILPSITADLRLPEGHAEQKHALGKQISDRTLNELVSAAKEKWGAGKARKLEKKLNFYRTFSGVRESPKYFWMKRFWVYKQAVIKEADALVKAGKLRKADDIYYLNFEQCAGLANGTFTPDYAAIDELRKNYEHWATLTPPRIMFSDGEVVQGRFKREIPGGALGGLAVSNGIIEGTARVITDIKDVDKIQKGDILVTTFTDPGWTPAFMSLGGLVTEIGGMATHGAVVSREYGLPCVVGVLNATRLIKDGSRIRLNGDLGYVEYVE